MGWKTSVIVIKSSKVIDERQLLSALGYQNIFKATDEIFETTAYSKKRHIYIGCYNGCTIICEESMPSAMLMDKITVEGQILSDYFDGAEIAVLLLHSAVNYWGFCIIKGGRLLRVKGGDADSGLLVEKGEALPQELPLLKKQQNDEKGNPVFYFDESLNGPFTLDQVGEQFVFAISKRYFDKGLDGDEELLETRLSGYIFEKRRKAKRTQGDTKVPRWKFW